MSPSGKTNLVVFLAALLSSLSIYFQDPKHFCITPECIRQFLAMFIPSICTGCVALLIRKPGDYSPKDIDDLLQEVARLRASKENETH